MPTFEDGEAGQSVRSKINAAITTVDQIVNQGGENTLVFASRAAFEQWVLDGNTAENGAIASDGTVQYVASAGETSIADLPGWAPFGFMPGKVETKDAAAGRYFSASVSSIVLSGLSEAGDAGVKATFQRVASEPSHTAKFRSADRYTASGAVDATNGGWWERVIDDHGVAVPWYGPCDTAANRLQTLTDAYAHWNTLSGTGFSAAGPTGDAAKLYFPKIPGLSNFTISSPFTLSSVGANCTIEGAGALMWLEDITLLIEHDEVRVSEWFCEGNDTYDGIRVGSANGRADRLIVENFFFNRSNYGIRIQDTSGAQFQNGYVMRSATDNMWMQSYDFAANPDASGNCSFHNVIFWVSERYNANIRGNGELKFVGCSFYGSDDVNMIIGGSGATGERVLQMYFTECTFTIGHDNKATRSSTPITSITDNGSGDIRVNYAAGTMPYLFEGQRQVRIETTVYGDIQGTQHITNVTNSSFDMPGVSYISDDTGTVYHGGWSIYIDNADAPVLDTTETYDLYFTGGTYNRMYVGRCHNVNFAGVAMGDQIYVDTGCQSFTRIGTSLGRYMAFNGGTGGSLDSVPISGPGKWASISNRIINGEFGAVISTPDNNASYTEAGSWGLPNELNECEVLGTGVTVRGSKVTIDTPNIVTRRIPEVAAFMSTTQSNITGGAAGWQTVSFDDETFDSGDDFNVATGEFTAPVDGRYDFDGQVALTGLTSVTRISARFSINGTDFIQVSDIDLSGSIDRLSIPFSSRIDLNASDVVTLQINGTGGTDTVDVRGVAGTTTFSNFNVKKTG